VFPALQLFAGNTRTFSLSSPSRVEGLFVATTSLPRRHSSIVVYCTVLLTIGFLYWAQKVAIPLALAMLLAFILTPAVSALQRRRLGRLPSVLIVTVLSFVLLGGLAYVISHQVTSLLIHLPSYKDVLLQKVDGLRSLGQDGVLGSIRQSTETITKQLVESAPAGTDQPKPVPGTTPDAPLYVATSTSGWAQAMQWVGPAGEALAMTFLVVVLGVFFLVQRENLRNRIVYLISHGHLALTTQAFDDASRRISRYLLSYAAVNLVFGALLTIGLFLLSFFVEEPGRSGLRTTTVLWGFLGAVVRFVPYLGTWLTAALLILFSFATLPGWWAPLVLFAYFLLLELVMANAVEPVVIGHSTGSSPVALLLAAAFWTWLWGPIGLLLSTPLTVVMVVLGKYVPQLEFLDVLLGDQPITTPDTTFYQRAVARDQDEASDLADDYLQKHDLEPLCEDIFIKAILRARQDLERGDIDQDTLQSVYQTTRDIFQDVVSLPEQSGDEAMLICCPARDEGEELILHFLAAILGSKGAPVRVLAAKMLAAEIVEQFTTYCPKVVCIASAAPGGVNQARYLCKRIRSYCREAKLFVARWGPADEAQRIEKRLKGTGADGVVRSLRECVVQIVPLLQAARASTTARPTEAVTPAPVAAH
jgi:predicted PurR-regulated permease PerM